MEAMSPQQETLGGQPGRSSSLTGMSWIAGGPGTKKKMKTLAERRRSAPSLILDKALQKRPSTKDSPSASMDTGAFLSSSMCSNRTLLIDGRVELKRGLQRQERHLFLFSDLFVVAKSKYNNNFKIKNKIKLSDMWTANCVDEVGEGNTDAMKSFVVGWPTVNFVATFSSPELKDKWLSLLQRYITLEKEKDYPKSIPLKIFAKDIGNCAYSKTITITNSDTANEVINMSLPMLGITGSDRDYQLWVNSGKEEAPYPLIGHEYPYGIKMSHLRDTALLTQEAKDSTNPSSLQEPFLMEQLPREMQCQFTLKPSRLAAAQQLSDSGQKTFKRRRSIINWAFWRGSGTHLDNSPMSPTSPMTGQLFGVSLTNICENDNLPKPVLDMLFFLNQQGPLTKGIFRQSANVKLCKELKEKLDSGADVRLDCESIFVIASVLKDFLRHIPRSIFSTDLYDNWVCVMDQGNDEEKINTIQRLLDQLPRANIVLLRYLFGVLHNIAQQSSSNQMNAYNLAVCIAPSILWSATSCCPELEPVFAKKVTLLIQFLIENCCRIFGEEITSLFGEVSVRCDIRENTSDLSCLQMTDSSYDSLENELNEDADAPCSDLVTTLGQGSRSMDSVLTLSDYDPDQPELEGLLTLSDFDLDRPKHEDIQLEGPLDSKAVTVTVLYGEATLQDHAGAPSGTTTPSHLSMAAEDAPKSPRRHRRCSEPSIDYRDAKLSSFREFYQKKLRKSSCDAILSQKDSGQKTFKRRRSIINWAFWRGSGTHLDNSPMSPTSPMTGQLFGVSLTNICENDNLPKPVLDMLFFLNQQGPLTEGIFRHSATVKLCKELKEKLDSGADVHLDCESIFVIASVLKDFLRHIPRSIFSTDLYDNWICVMDQGNDEEKINTIQRLLDQLPRANIVLLRYLFGVLHNIAQQSSSNQMNAYNLAVCIAPSILWSATSCSPELEPVFAKKVTLLIQFLIENCCRIFGEEITSLFGEVSVRCDIRENTSDLSCLQMTDSSYDNLENELNEDADAPCSDLVTTLGQGSRSMDSVLTLSDYDPDQPELEGLLTLSDFDLDRPKHEDIQLEGPLDSKAVTVTVLYGEATLQDHAGAPSGTTTPSHLSMAAEDAPKSPRRHRRCSEPSIDYRDAKLSSFREFYQKKLRKSSCDAILSQKGEDHLKQNEPPREEGKTCFKQAVVTGTDNKKNASNKNAKKKGFFAHEGSHMKLPPPSKPVAIAVASCNYMSSHDCPRSQASDVDTPGRATTNAADAPKRSRRHRCCSEPSINDQHSKLSYLRRIFSRKHNKGSYEVGPLPGEEEYLQQHKSLQMEGQKLINQSLVMGIEVGKSGATSQSTETLLPSRLSICPRTSCSSLSSPGTAPSGSSVSSQDSDFSQISEHSVFTPTETSPIDCTFQAHGQHGEPSDFGSSRLTSGGSGPASGQASSRLAYTKKDTLERHSHMHSVTLHPSTWLRNGMASLKNWSLKNKTRAARPEERKIASLPGPAEPRPHASGAPEANPQQETQKDMPLRAAAELPAVPTAQQHSSDPSHVSEPRGSSPSSQVEGTLELCLKSQEEGESNGQCSPGTPPCERSSPGSLVMDDESSPDSGPTVVCDVADKHSTKDILPQEEPDV